MGVQGFTLDGSGDRVARAVCYVLAQEGDTVAVQQMESFAVIKTCRFSDYSGEGGGE